jgi:hypothetical protein
MQAFGIVDILNKLADVVLGFLKRLILLQADSFGQSDDTQRRVVKTARGITARSTGWLAPASALLAAMPPS